MILIEKQIFGAVTRKVESENRAIFMDASYIKTEKYGNNIHRWSLI